MKKAVNYFSTNLTRKEKNVINTCLELIQFGMGDTSLTFQDKYCEHGGSLDPSKRGLTIGGYESAWLANLVVAWILKQTENLFRTTIEISWDK